MMGIHAMRVGLAELVGKRITGIVVADSEAGPHGQVFIICADNTYYEFYSLGSPISGASRMEAGGLGEIRASVRSDAITCEVVDTIGAAEPALAR